MGAGFSIDHLTCNFYFNAIPPKVFVDQKEQAISLTSGVYSELNAISSVLAGLVSSFLPLLLGFSLSVLSIGVFSMFCFAFGGAYMKFFYTYNMKEDSVKRHVKLKLKTR